MEISLTGAGKKFYSDWIFRNVSLHLKDGSRTAITGPNGSGKSTFIQVLAGAVMLTEGKVMYSANEKPVADDQVYRHMSFASPYLEVIEEFTLKEMVEFHRSMKPSAYTTEEMLCDSGLEGKADSVIKFFSSGMKQRVRLTLALLTAAPVILLDEPCSNLDNSGVQWYRQMIDKHGTGKTIIVASNNHEEEYFFCSEQITMTQLKNGTSR